MVYMGDFNWKKLLDNPLFLQYLKSTLEGIDLTTAPGISDITQNVRTGIRGQGIG